MKATRAYVGTCKGGISPLQLRMGQLTLIPGPSVVRAVLTDVPEAVAFETTLCDGDGGEGDAGAVLTASEPELNLLGVSGVFEGFFSKPAAFSGQGLGFALVKGVSAVLMLVKVALLPGAVVREALREAERGDAVGVPGTRTPKVGKGVEGGLGYCASEGEADADEVVGVDGVMSELVKDLVLHAEEAAHEVSVLHLRENTYRGLQGVIFPVLEAGEAFSEGAGLGLGVVLLLFEVLVLFEVGRKGNREALIHDLADNLSVGGLQEKRGLGVSRRGAKI
jgi:hypothetical protein